QKTQGQIPKPNIGFKSNKKAKHALPSGFQGSGSTAPRNLKCCSHAASFAVLRLLTLSPPRTTEPSWKEQPSQPSVIIPVPGCTGERIERQLACMLYFVNKTIKLYKKKKT
ncbi:unnamed protein product, partial [Gulo gulo]